MAVYAWARRNILFVLIFAALGSPARLYWYVVLYWDLCNHGGDFCCGGQWKACIRQVKEKHSININNIHPRAIYYRKSLLVSL